MKEIERCVEEAGEIVLSTKDSSLPDDIKNQINDFLYPLLPGGFTLDKFEACSLGLLLWLNKQQGVK